MSLVVLYITMDTVAGCRCIGQQAAVTWVGSKETSRTIDTRRLCELTLTQKVEVKQYIEIKTLRMIREDVSKYLNRTDWGPDRKPRL